MKNLFFFTLLISGLTFSQMPDISNVWMNNSHSYTGTISKDKTPIQVKFNISEQDQKKDQEYFISGFSLVENNSTKFEGKLRITKYKDGSKRNTVFGEYELAEEVKGQHSGIFRGKFIYTFIWNKKTQQIEKQFIEFTGDWKSYDGSLNYPTNWQNQPS